MMGPWACSPHWNVIYLEMAVEGGRGGELIIGEKEAQGRGR